MSAGLFAPAPCKGGCDHSAAEHRAFDRGVRAGEAGVSSLDCPLVQRGKREAWLAGHSVGTLNAEALGFPVGAKNAQARRLIWDGIRAFAIGSPEARRQATIDINCILDVLAPVPSADAAAALPAVKP